MIRLRRICRSTPAWVVFLAIGLLAAGVNGVMVGLHPPAPHVHDEFSYLLAADTFVEGRLTNPTHEHWPHFETMHVIQRPSYASKYPPGQGLLLASGRLLAGSVLAGVCFSTGLAAAACAWMLRAWMPVHWAAIGGLLVAFHPGIQLQWGMSYWGGALAMSAGAVVLGSAGRLARPGARLTANAVAFALGALLLAVTRPYEGFLVVLGSALVVLAHWFRGGPAPWRRLALRVAAPVVAIGAAGVCGLLVYNQAVTGSALRMPYQAHEAEYGATPLFLWQTAETDREYRNPALARYHLAASMWWYKQQQSLWDLLFHKGWLTRCQIEFFMCWPVAWAALAVGWIRRRSQWPWLGLGLATWLGGCLVVWMFPHYLAPMAPLLVLLMVAAVRSFRCIERRLPPGRRWITPALLGLQLLVFGVTAFDHANKSQRTWAHGRQHYLERLASAPGDDLVLVHYAPDHNIHEEWVYNRADIDGAPVVWARSLGEEQDRRLIEYFRGRRVWLLFPDCRPIRLLPAEALPESLGG